jgi:hypothetical protein
MKKEVEILWKGIVHYRRPEGDPDVTEVARLIEKGNTLCSIQTIDKEDER